uniref:Uncharacterized protein n=1 Tax=Zea mays TaxID=4577 RepID=A0A804RBK7_MAIZE
MQQQMFNNALFVQGELTELIVAEQRACRRQGWVGGGSTRARQALQPVHAGVREEKDRNTRAGMGEQATAGGEGRECAAPENKQFALLEIHLCRAHRGPPTMPHAEIHARRAR